MQKRFLFLALCFFCLANVVNAGAETEETETPESTAKDVSTKTKAKKKDYYLETEISTEYDTNVFDYSQDDRAEYKSYTTPNRFKGVDSLDDFITRISFNAGLEKKILDIGTTVFDLGIRGNIYAENDDKNYEVYDVSLKQRIGKDNLVKVGYEYLPKYFVRTLRDADILSGDRFRKAEFKNNNVYLKYWNRVKKSLTWWIQYTYGDKDYNSDFNERDTQFHKIDLSSVYKPFAWIKFNPRFTYSINNAAASDGDANVDSDISQEEYRAGLYVNLYPQKKLSYLLGYNFYWINYTTDNAVTADPFHTGRDDKMQHVNFRVNYALEDNLIIYLGYQYEINNAEAIGTDATQREESILGYDKHIVKTGVTISF